MYERIVVAVDGSPFSEEVIPYALGIAKATGAKVTLLRIAEKGTLAEAEEYLQMLAALNPVETRVVESQRSVPEDILREANSTPNSLVAVTSHGRGGVLIAVLGSVAREIVQVSHNPVLVYRPEEESIGHDPIRITSVLLPLDGSALSESMKPQAAEWARALGVPLTVVQVLPSTKRMDSLLASYDALDSSYVTSHATDIAREYGVQTDWEVLHGDPADAIARYLDGRRDVLAVMATREQNVVKAAVLGSVTSGMVHKAGIPIVVQAPARAMQDAVSNVRAERR
ncbi:universal stress protein [Parafrigoribacterium soli]|uniref:universal stress protein n=1 Tax=Parafrigoribacterium soli TaxID=3144663 RepID=UPI0032EBF737